MKSKLVLELINRDVRLTELSRLKGSGLSDSAIARLWRCDRRTVFNYRKRLGIKCSKWKVIP